MAIIFIAALTVVLTGAHGLALSSDQTSSWILVLYGLPAVASLVLTVRYRQPLLLTGNIFAIIFVASLAEDFRYEELAGASLLAGVGVLMAAAFGLTGHLARWVPTPIVFGLVAGAVLPYVSGIFTALGDEAGLVGAALVAYVVSQRVLGPRVSPVLSALVAGLVVASATGGLGEAPGSISLPPLGLITPELSLRAVVTVTPVLIVMITLQSNIPSTILLRSHGFQPPERLVDLVSGAATVAGSFVGPLAVSIAVPLVPLAAGPAAGPQHLRYRSVYVAGLVMLLIAISADAAAALAGFVPRPLLLSVAGLALIAILTSALQEVTRGPLHLGPVLSFAVALSDLSLLELGPFFWALVIGTSASLLLERDGWNQLRRAPAPPPK